MSSSPKNNSKKSASFESEASIDRSSLIDTLPIAYMAYEAHEPYRIIDENKAHEQIALTKREGIIGRPFLEVFPDTSTEFKSSGKSAPIESIKKIVRTGKPDSLGEFNYDIPGSNGSYITKYWRSTQYPIFDDAEKVVAVYQLTEDITSSKTTERQLSVTRYQLAQTLANGSIGTWLWDIKAQKVYGDENLILLYGLDEKAVGQGLPLEEFVNGIYEADRERVSDAIEIAVAQQSNFEQEYRTIDREGSMRWVIARGRVEVDQNGELDRFPGVAIDITERKDAEQALLESESRLRFMADSMPQLAWTARPDGYREYFNQKWYQFTGSSGSENDGDGWAKYIFPEDSKRVLQAWRHSVKTGEPYEVEYRLYHAPSNSYRWLIGRGLPFRDAGGNIIKWYGTSTDIDKQKHASLLESFLAKASKELSASLDYKATLKKVTRLSVPTIGDWCSVDLYDVSTDTFEQISIEHADPTKVDIVRAYRKFNPGHGDGKSGISKVVQTGMSEFYPIITSTTIENAVSDPEKLAFMKTLNLHSLIIAPIAVRNQVIGAISFVSTDSGRHFTHDDLHMAEELASRVALAIVNSRLYDESLRELNHRKELEKALLVEKQKLESRVKERTEQLQLTNQGLRDEIVKRHEVEQALQQNSNNLQRSNQELQDFAYVASHDLQEPLRKIQAFGNLLESEYAEQLGDGADYLARMRNAASRMSTLIQDLLSFSRVTTKAQPSVDVDLNETVREVLQDLESRIEETNGTIDVEDLPTVSADPTHMRQLFQNLISNALKFHRPDVAPHVAIDFIGDGPGYCEIRVTDNGIGFDQKYNDKIFAVFQRLHERDVFEGTGIGLAVVRKIVERYGGTITAKSAKNKGATFIVRLPKNGGK